MRVAFAIWIALLLIVHAARGPESLAGFPIALFLGLAVVGLFFRGPEGIEALAAVGPTSPSRG